MSLTPVGITVFSTLTWEVCFENTYVTSHRRKRTNRDDLQHMQYDSEQNKDLRVSKCKRSNKL